MEVVVKVVFGEVLVVEMFVVLVEEVVEELVEELTFEIAGEKSYKTSVESMSCRASSGTSVAASSYPGSMVVGSSVFTVLSDLAAVLVVPHVVNSSASVVVSVAVHFASWDGSSGSKKDSCFSVDITFVSVVRGVVSEVVTVSSNVRSH